jgi:hypothetical protein
MVGLGIKCVPTLERDIVFQQLVHTDKITTVSLLT